MSINVIIQISNELTASLKCINTMRSNKITFDCNIKNILRTKPCKSAHPPSIRITMNQPGTKKPNKCSIILNKDPRISSNRHLMENTRLQIIIRP